jgi:hypothetical protein
LKRLNASTYPGNLSTQAEYIRKFRTDKGVSGRKLPKELGVAEFTVIGGRMQRVYPSKSSVEPVLLCDPLRYSVNILLKSILSPIFHPR